MPRWFTLDEVIVMEKTFSYLTSEADFEELKAMFKEAEPKRKTKGKRRA